MMKRQLAIGLFFVLLAPFAIGAELGVNYYHESLMTENGVKYMPRSIDEVRQDMHDIHSIANNVKIFMNPYSNGNAAWAEEINSAAKQEGLHTVIAMMVDKHQLTQDTWGEYSTRVLAACQQFNGKADELHVGNEITLHSPLSREEIKNRVVQLMEDCDAVFDGQVSYQEFWYANSVWEGYNKRIYFMMYENWDEYQKNMGELESKFGANGAIGEWGEDQLEDNAQYDETWQKDQIQKRWQVIQNSQAPVAYIFTYREPSTNGFGMLRPDGSKKPLWEVFGAPSEPPKETPREQPVQETPAPEKPTETPVQETPIEAPGKETPPPLQEEQTPVQNSTGNETNSTPQITVPATNITDNTIVVATLETQVQTNSTGNETNVTTEEPARKSRHKSSRSSSRSSARAAAYNAPAYTYNEPVYAYKPTAYEQLVDTKENDRELNSTNETNSTNFNSTVPVNYTQPINDTRLNARPNELKTEAMDFAPANEGLFIRFWNWLSNLF